MVKMIISGNAKAQKATVKNVEENLKTYNV